MKNLSMVALKKTYDSSELYKVSQTKRFDISDKSPFVSNFKLIDEKEKNKVLMWLLRVP